MSGIGEAGGLPGFAFSGGQVAPSDMDRYETASFVFPSNSINYLGTASLTAAGALVFDNTKLDYPRNILLTITGVAGGMGGTATINGTDRWGNSIQETLGFGSAAGGGSVSGTRIFTRVSSGTLTGIASVGGTGVGTTSVGFAIGTGAGDKFWLGLPTRLGGTSDVKSVTHIHNFVLETINGGTINGSVVNGTYNAISGTAVLGSADVYVATFKPTYDNLGKGKIANLT